MGGVPVFLDANPRSRQQWSSRRARAQAPRGGAPMRAASHLRPRRPLATAAIVATMLAASMVLPWHQAGAQSEPDPTNPELPIPSIPDADSTTTTVPDDSTTTSTTVVTDPTAEPDPPVPP